MKKPLIYISLMLIFALSFQDTMAQKKKKNRNKKKADTEVVEPAIQFNSMMDSVSYIIGHELGTNLSIIHTELNLELVEKAITAAFNGDSSVFSKAVSDSVMNIFQQCLIDKENESNKEEIDMNKEAGAQFLAQNKLRDEVTELPSGLQYEVLMEGEGEKPVPTSEVTVHYKGMLIDGSVFDSSYDRNETITFGLGNVIKGWTEGLQLMNPGAKYVFYIPPELGYGDRGVGPIPGGSTLIFEVELFSFK